MTCVHLRQLYELCQKHELKIGATDLVRVVCHQCGEQEVCPSMLMDEYEAKEQDANKPPTATKGDAEDSSSAV
ncbi:MAG: hypothetical protein ACR2NP_19035 [Pirellulaceae bacterium]